jgi:hypothetical protein
MLDDLVLLSEGNTMYIGQASNALGWFQSLGFVCPASSAPADWFLDTISKVGGVMWDTGSDDPTMGHWECVTPSQRRGSRVGRTNAALG